MAPTPLRSLIGSPQNFWIHRTTHGFDLTHPSSPKTPLTTPTLTLRTTTVPITIDPAKSALVIIDMQNFFLAPELGRDPKSAGHTAAEKLIEHAIPAARKAGIRIVWLNWGLTDEDLRTMPPGVRRCFGFWGVPESESEAGSDVDAFASDFEGGSGVGVDRFGVPRASHGKDAMYHGLGAPCGPVTLGSGEVVDAGKLLVRDAWNADLYPPLKALFSPEHDVWIHKNRMSGLWGTGTPLAAFLEAEGIRSLLFAGVNTDQCVGGTLTDAFSNGFDCVLMGDGCGTSSGEGPQKAWEFNAERSYGFCVSCEELAKGVEGM